MRPAALIEKSVLLLGAGNAHLRFVRMFGMRPMPGVAVTLVSESPTIAYSAMVPGHIGGEYRRDEILIDLVRLRRAHNVRFVADRATGIDPIGQAVAFDSRPQLSYDVVSLGLGSVPVRPGELIDGDWSWPMRPLSDLLDRLDALELRLRRSPQPFRMVVVGGGASGCELTAAIHKRFAAFVGFQLTLVQSDSRLLPQFPARAARLFGGVLRQKGVGVRLGARVTGGEERVLHLGGERLPYDAVLWATNGGPPELLRSSGLRLDGGGFLLVGDTLQSVDEPSVFGTGDCVSLASHPGLPRNGVHAVRQGGVLFENVGRFLREKSLTKFRPQKLSLCLMNASDGSAVLAYGPLALKARSPRWLKDRIDRAWMDRFTRFAPMSDPDAPDAPLMRCGGCGSKISSDVLSAVLKRIDIPDDPRVVLGCRAGEDAAVHRFDPALFGGDPAKLVEVQTVDYFKAFVDDPYLFGRVAALNSVSDLYAMNARPFAAMAIATLPYARGPVQEAMLYELMSGAAETLRQLGVTLTGGHTTEGAELALGFAVTGYAEQDRLFQKSKLRVGDRLILTKPLGSGALLAAWMRGECPAAWFAPLMQTLLLANDRAGAIFRDAGVTACTDVTGFGLAGHLLEMLDGSGVGARLDAGRVPLYEGFAQVTQRGIVSSLHADNVRSAMRVAGPAHARLFDPQTSGGLIAGVAAEKADGVVRALIDAGHPAAAVVGEVVALGEGEAPFIRVTDP